MSTRDSAQSGLKNLVRAAAGALPFVPRGDTLPDRTLTVDGLTIDPANVAAYANVTGLRFGDAVPLTYPFALTFPTVMSLVTGFDFPFAAMGSVHIENHITQYRPIAVTDTVDVAVHAENLREHRKGLLVDIVTDVKVGNDTAWHQVTTFLHQQRTSLSDEPKPPPEKQPKLRAAERGPAHHARARSATTHRSAGTTTRSTPTRSRAKLFGFPTVIAHGMFSAAAVLANIEGQLPDAVKYSVRFAKPVVLPARAGLYVDRITDGWELTLRDLTKGYPHLTGTRHARSTGTPVRVDVLRLVQPLVQAAFGHQRVVVALLRDAPVLEHQDPIGHGGNEVHVVTDHEARAVLAYPRITPVNRAR